MYFFPSIKNLPYSRQCGNDYKKIDVYDHVYDFEVFVKRIHQSFSQYFRSSDVLFYSYSIKA